MTTNNQQPALIHKSLGVEGCKVLDGELGIVEAYVSGIGNKDSGGDIIISGAFDRSLESRKPKGIWSHDWDKPVSKTLEIYEVSAGDPRLPLKMQLNNIGGLYVKTQFNMNTQLGKDAYETVRFYGDEAEWSIGYQVVDQEFDPTQKAMILKEIELFEYSPVLFGMNPLTATVSIKVHKTDSGELEYDVDGLSELETKAVSAALNVILEEKQMTVEASDEIIEDGETEMANSEEEEFVEKTEEVEEAAEIEVEEKAEADTLPSNRERIEAILGELQDLLGSEAAEAADAIIADHVEAEAEAATEEAVEEEATEEAEAVAEEVTAEETVEETAEEVEAEVVAEEADDEKVVAEAEVEDEATEEVAAEEATEEAEAAVETEVPAEEAAEEAEAVTEEATEEVAEEAEAVAEEATEEVVEEAEEATAEEVAAEEEVVEEEVTEEASAEDTTEEAEDVATEEVAEEEASEEVVEEVVAEEASVEEVVEVDNSDAEFLRSLAEFDEMLDEL